MEKKEIIRKIKGLLELAANDPESNESKLAAERAGILQAKYNIQYLAEDSKDIDGIVKETTPVFMSKNVTWSHILITGIAVNFDCQAIKKVGAYKGDNSYEFAIVGYKHDVEIAMYYFKFLRTMIAKKGEDQFKKLKERKAYQTGFCHAVIKRLQEMNKTKEAHTDVKTKDLVVVKKNDVLKAYQQHFPNKKKNYSNAKLDPHAYHKGMNDGKNASLSRPIAPSKGRETIIAGKVALG